MDQNTTAAGTLTLGADSVVVAPSTMLQSGGDLTVTGDNSANLLINNQGSITSTGGSLAFTSGLGKDLLIAGGGAMTADGSGGKTIDFTATDNPGVSDPSIEFSGSQNFFFSGVTPSGTVNFNATGSGQAVAILTGQTATFGKPTIQRLI